MKVGRSHDSQIEGGQLRLARRRDREPDQDLALVQMAWNASLIKGDVAAELAKIKQQPGGNIVKYGITNLDRTLLAAGLVDEYQIWVIPKVIGEGERAFEDVDHELVRLKLVDTHRFKNGVMVLTYVPQ
jgi:dihydrofolate reductase